MDSNSLDSVRAQNTDRGLFSLPEELILNISELVLATGRTKDKKAMRHTCSTLRRVVPNSVLGGVVSEREVLRRNIETNGGFEPWTSIVELSDEQSQLDNPALGGCETLADLWKLLPKMDTWTNLTIKQGETYPCRRVAGALRSRPDGGYNLRFQWPRRITSTTGRNYTLTNAPFSSGQKIDLEVAVNTLHLMPFRQSGLTSTNASEYHTQTLPIPKIIELGVPLDDNPADTTALVASVDSLLASLHEQHGPLRMRRLHVCLGGEVTASQYRQVIDIASASCHTFDEVELGPLYGPGPSLCGLVTDESVLNGMPPGKFILQASDIEGSEYGDREDGRPHPRTGSTTSPGSRSLTHVIFKLRNGEFSNPDRLRDCLKVHSQNSTFRFIRSDGAPLTAYDTSDQSN